jgi:hypothetical protein
METVGCIPFALGLLVVAIGFLWQFLGYRFGDALFVQSLMWGLMGIGVGLVLMGTFRRAVAVTGVLVSCLSLAITVTWHLRVSPLPNEWLWDIGVPNCLAIPYGITAFVTTTVRSRRARKTSSST